MQEVWPLQVRLLSARWQKGRPGPRDKEKPKDKASKASEEDKDEAGFVRVVEDSDADSMPDLRTVTDSLSVRDNNNDNGNDDIDVGRRGLHRPPRRDARRNPPPAAEDE